MSMHSNSPTGGFNWPWIFPNGWNQLEGRIHSGVLNKRGTDIVEQIRGRMVLDLENNGRKMGVAGREMQYMELN